MNRIDLEIKARSPLAIGKQKPNSSVSEADEFISGSVIRGAIAAQILQQSGHSSNDFSTNGGDFQNLFLGDRPAIFQNAYLATVTTKDENDPDKTIILTLPDVQVLPATALSSKNSSGFKTELKKNGESKNNGVFDTLIDRFCAGAYGHLYDPNCPTDGDRVDAFTGFYGKIKAKGENKYTYYKPSVDKRLLTRVGINRRRAVSEEQILYSIEVMNESKPRKTEPSIYRSSIYIEDDDLASSLQQFIHNNSKHFRFGGSASRGLGKTEIAATLAKQAKSDLSKRVDSFNQKLTKRWQDWQIFGKHQEDVTNNRKFFTLDLQSDAILTDQWRRTTVISETMLKQFTGLVDDSLKLHVAYSSYDYRSGWNAAWGLMKDVELVTNRGGVYLFSVNEKGDRFAEWLEALQLLEISGIGDRPSEGFGQFQVCNDFHLVLREEAV